MEGKLWEREGSSGVLDEQGIPRTSNGAGSGKEAVKSRGTPFRSVAEWSSKGSVSESVLVAFFFLFFFFP